MLLRWFMIKKGVLAKFSCSPSQICIDSLFYSYYFYSKHLDRKFYASLLMFSGIGGGSNDFAILIIIIIGFSSSLHGGCPVMSSIIVQPRLQISDFLLYNNNIKGLPSTFLFLEYYLWCHIIRSTIDGRICFYSSSNFC